MSDTCFCAWFLESVISWADSRCSRGTRCRFLEKPGLFQSTASRPSLLKLLTPGRGLLLFFTGPSGSLLASELSVHVYILNRLYLHWLAEFSAPVNRKLPGEGSSDCSLLRGLK